MSTPLPQWTVENNQNYTPPWVLRYDPSPGGKKNADGSTTYSVNFPALQVTDWVGDPEESLAGVALALNRDALFGEMVAVIEEGRRAIGDHYAPNDCYATGPLTGDPIRDLVECPACTFINMYDAYKSRAVLAKVREAGK
jgi:hypothetical protein